MKRLPLILPLVLLLACQTLETPVAPLDEERPEWLPSASGGGFQWTKAEDIETRRKFIRNFGVGYSYNAVRGSFCDWSDIRCQIVNRQAIEAYQELSGDILGGSSNSQSISTHSKFTYSKRDYVAAVHLETEQKIDIGLYNKTKRSRQDFLEDGIEESFYYTLDEEIIMADMYIADGNVLNYYMHDDRCDNFLTVSFVNAVLHIAESDPTNIAVVDSFVNIYGTHVITQAWLGGKIRVDLSNYMWRYKDNAKEEEEWDSGGFIDAVKDAGLDHTGKDEYKWLEHGRLNITAYGGNQTTLTGLLGEHAPDGTRTFSTEGISQWRKSLFFDPENEARSNIELVDMRLRPIWEFARAIDDDAADRIKAAILQDVSLQQSLLGENNFFDTSFPIRYTKAGACYAGRFAPTVWYIHDKPDVPIVVNIVSGGRYVACVCHETIGSRDLWVCYPIYEGKIKMPCGLGVDSQGRVFSVMWINGKATVLRVESERAADTFYITAGEIGVSPQEGVTYAESKYMPYIELAGGVQPDGTYYVSDAYQVVRDGADFVLHDCKKVPSNMIGWDSEGRRLPDYVYIYNPNELKPYGN